MTWLKPNSWSRF